MTAESVRADRMEVGKNTLAVVGVLGESVVWGLSVVCGLSVVWGLSVV